MNNTSDPQSMELLTPILVDSAHSKLIRRRFRNGFIRGPLPLNWFSRASSLPGKALAVGLGLWFRVGVTKSREVKLSAKTLSRFAVSRKAVYGGLKTLEAAGLVRVQRQIGKSAVITVLDIQDTQE